MKRLILELTVLAVALTGIAQVLTENTPKDTQTALYAIIYKAPALQHIKDMRLVKSQVILADERE